MTDFPDKTGTASPARTGDPQIHKLVLFFEFQTLICKLREIAAELDQALSVEGANRNALTSALESEAFGDLFLSRDGVRLSEHDGLPARVISMADFAPRRPCADK